MENLMFSARLLLVAVFALAGIAKLADAAGARQALRGFGVPDRLVRPAAVLLPVTELAVALSLLWLPGAWWASLVGCSLLLAFAAGIGWNVLHGRTPDCHCFGQVHSAPAGWPTFGRNLGLAGVAAAIVVAGPERAGADLYAWLGGLETGALLAVLAGAVGLGLIARGVWVLNDLRARVAILGTTAPAAGSEGLARAVPAGSGSAAPTTHGHETVSPPADGLRVGTPAPGFRLPRLSGDSVGLDHLLGAGRPLLLAFVDPQCGPCMALLPELGHWHRERPDLSLVVISRGDAAANRAKAEEHGLDAVYLLQVESEVAWSYEAYATPSMVLVQSDGRVGSPLAKGAEAIRALVQSTGAVPLTDARPRPHPAVSASAIDDDVVVYDSRTGQGHVLNATAAHVWNLLDGERTTAALGEAVAARYSLPLSEAVKDVRELVDDLTRAGLVVA